jgi:hypothetical protein
MPASSIRRQPVQGLYSLEDNKMNVRLEHVAASSAARRVIRNLCHTAGGLAVLAIAAGLTTSVVVTAPL